jgi:GNAT superfamily N-acetyltransferase
MFWRLSRSQFQKQKGEENNRALKRLVESGDAPGLLAYADGEPVGWCAIAPRDAYPALARSRLLQPVDDRPVWSISCLFVARPFRRKGVSVGLLKAVTDYVRKRGGTIVEGYPQEPRKAEMPDVFAWTGLASAFRAGFKECLRRSAIRPIMRFEI